MLTVWAHPDDDIIFANPTISDAIGAGRCVRTVFVTAGDAGKGMGYVQARELGILRAYNAMRGKDGEWDVSEITLDTGMKVRRLTPKDDPRVSALFLRLPDGNITGAGFDATGHATLSKLYDGAAGSLSPVDGGPAVTRDQLVASVRELASAFAPESTLTHIPRGSAFAPGDHPDHSVVGALVRDTLTSDAAVGPGIRYFVGYPSENLPRNLEGAVLDRKVDTYRIYTQQDQVIRCADRTACLKTRKFGEWLQRSYPKAEGELQMG
ncbi:PIG-L family deacetylase [Microbacterium testaceum]|uniref:PIG-L family deacetylase n=1 Tax=Microbacterium testaceum TaxID=2033 RepID=UPI001CD9ADE9|nr:PIG-L family deacetylase [Microbacterium testaceum]